MALTISNFRSNRRSNEHELVPEWVRRELQAHDKDLDVVFFRWWAGTDQAPGEQAAGRFLIMVRRKSRAFVRTPPIRGEGQLNLDDWHIVHVVEDDHGAFKRPDRETVALVLAADISNATAARYLREIRERADRVRQFRKRKRREERREILVPEIEAGLAGRVAVNVLGKIGGA